MRWFALMLLFAPAEVHAFCKDHPLAHAGASARALVRPGRVALLAGAVVTPFVLAPTGGDQAIRVFSQRHGGRYDLEHSSLTVPYALGASLVVASLGTAIFGDCEGARVGNALLQSVLVAALGTSVLKLGIGRGYPTGGGDPTARDRLADRSRATRIDGPGHYGAWPSGHAAVTFAFASALRVVLPRAGIARYAGYLLAAGVSVGMVFGDHHWGSDVISGALFGEAIGSAIGTGFRGAETRVWSLAPWPGGVAWSSAF